MIDRQALKIVIECDACDQTIESGEREEWNSFWSYAKRFGWRARKIGEERVHECPVCRSTEMRQ